MDGQTKDKLEHEAALTRFGGRMPNVPTNRKGARFGRLAGLRYRYIPSGKLARSCAKEYQFETIR